FDNTEYRSINYINRFTLTNNSWRSMYEENGDFYIDQPFVGIFNINSDDLYMLDQIIKKGDKEEILIPVNNILKSNF
ncbi:hypothetical protein, partial [Tissierella praeacuta]|uniref:hypothetical protein n=1 Tax=Tissierella praeacuta TaxID=43131 RepID=UPI00333F5FEC